MLPDFEMVVHTLPNRDITIFPICDVHLGARECREKDFIQFVEEVAKMEDTYVFLLGDLLDNGTRNSVTNIFRAVKTPSQAKREMAEILMPIKDKLLVSVSGNHERRNRDCDDDPCYDIMAKLDKENLHRENMAFVKLTLGEQYKTNGVRYNSKYRTSYTFMVCHGAGGGALPGGVINRNERMAYSCDGVDAVVVGHSHKPMLSQPGKIVVDNRNEKVSIVPFKVIVATSWLDYGDYTAQKMLLPSSHCIQKITLSSSKKEMVVTM